MSKSPQVGTQAQNATLKAYQDKVSAQVQEAKAKLEEIEAAARQKKAQAEIAAIGGLKTAKEHIDTKLQDLQTTHDENVSRAKADIDAHVASFKTSIDRLAAKLKTNSAKK